MKQNNNQEANLQKLNSPFGNSEGEINSVMEKQRKESSVEKNSHEFVSSLPDSPSPLDLGKIEPDPIKHIKEAQNCLSKVILLNRRIFGLGGRSAYLIAQAQNQLNLALRDLDGN